MSIFLWVGAAVVLALISFAAGRSVGWHARGYYEVAMADLKEATIKTVIKEEMDKLQHAETQSG